MILAIQTGQTPMDLKCLAFLSYSLLLILSTECALSMTQSEIGNDTHHIRCIAREMQALLRFKSSLQSSHLGRIKSWGREGHEDNCCKWSRVECSSTTGHVTRLDLSWIYYEGCMVNASLAELRYLRYLNLSHNVHNNCRIPEFIGHLSKLEELDLSYSRFGGMIPHQLRNLSMLKFLDLSGNDFDGSSIPESFEFLVNLNHLSIADSQIGGKIQDQLRNLSKLQYLDLSDNFHDAYSNQLEWVSHLYSLQYLNLGALNLSKAFDWGRSLMNLSHLTELHMWGSFPPILEVAPPTMTPKHSSPLSVVDLSYNSLTSFIFTWLLNFNSSLSEIHLDENILEGHIPSDFGNMPFLFYLDISSNELEGELPSSFGCPIGKSHCSSLGYLILSNNHLNGNLSNSITQLHKLSYLDLSSNSFHGVISEDHLSNFTSIKHLFLSSNPLTLSFIPYWIPPFQLYSIGLSSCNIGPQLQRWLQTQTSFYFLDISSNQISGTLPNWFWNLSSKTSYLNISNNRIYGEVPSEPFSQNPALIVDLSNNHFEGWLPLFNQHMIYVDLSKNNFIGTLSSICKFSKLQVLDLSDNHLSGELPQCWRKKSYEDLILLSLSNNNIKGNIHNSICSSVSPSLTILQLSNNSFTGELPSSLNDCYNLQLLDVASNMLSGSFPEWPGFVSLRQLQIIILRSNQFSGSIPESLFWLPELRVIDFSHNKFTRFVASFLDDSTTLAGKKFLPNFPHSVDAPIYATNVTSLEGFSLPRSYPIRVHERIMWKGMEYEYNRNLEGMRMVDFSNNKLQGEIPEEFGKLVALLQLNLSNNNLSGSIPKSLGELRELEVLDLSSNHLLGEIPQSISNLNFLDKLDLSNNNLSGQIPKGTQIQTQSAASFMGNPRLCGDPLLKNCHQEEAAPHSSNFGFGGHEEEENGLIFQGFYTSMVVGFVIGFWGVLGSLLFHKSWSSTYFRSLNNGANWMYVRSSLLIAKILRK